MSQSKNQTDWVYFREIVHTGIHSYRPLVDGNKVDGGEPAMILDVCNSVLQVAETFGQIDLQQTLQNVFQILTEV